MKCPVDNVALVMSERSGIEIDYCPECRGVWLDRGELDKIVERSAIGASASQPKTQSYSQPTDESSQRHPNDYEYGYQKKRKKENFLSDLFDF